MSESQWQDAGDNARFRTIFGGSEVLITGGLGFIGSNLAIKLVAAGASVTIIDSLIPLFGGNLANVQEVHDRVTINLADLRDIPALENAVRGKNYIFHLAGQVSHGDSMRDPQLDLEVNCVSTMNLVEACRRHNRGVRMLYTSTRQVYGRPHRLPVTEDHPTLPIDVNGINKLAAEYYHLLYDSVYGVRSTVLRVTNTYGPRQKLDTDRQGVAAVFINRALQQQTIHLFGGGNQRRDFNYVDDVVDAMLLAISSEQCHGRVFNLGARRAHTLMHFAQILQRLCGCRIVSAPFPDEGKLIDIGDYFGDFSALNEATGWEPRVDLEQGLTRTIAFYRDHLEFSRKEPLAVP
jgi:nucleoside-diphosphate-sugar epimerase